VSRLSDWQQKFEAFTDEQNDLLRRAGHEQVVS
jgi:hypothetical protein